MVKISPPKNPVKKLPELKNAVRFEESLQSDEEILPYTHNSQYNPKISWGKGKPDGLVHTNDYNFKFHYDLIVADEDLSNIEKVYSTHLDKLNKYPVPCKLIVMMRNNEFIDKYNQINTNPNIIIVKEPSSFEENLAKQDINYDYLYDWNKKL